VEPLEPAQGPQLDGYRSLDRLRSALSRLARKQTADVYCSSSNNQQRPAAMKVTIREWNAVAAWRWDMPDDDVCGICRNPYDSTCSKCKFPGDECPLRMLSQIHFPWLC
jgi:anaphase-promoting complex subunit 11